MRRELVLLTLTLGCTRSTPPPRNNVAVTESPPPRANTTTTTETTTAEADGGLVASARDVAVAGDAASVANAAGEGDERPLYYERAITPDDLRGRSLRELALMRNMPYARMGHRFRRPWLHRYFTSQDWYRPSRFVQASELSAVDRQNSDAVARYDVALERADLQRMRDELLQRQRDRQLREDDAVEALLLSSRLGERIAVEGVSDVDPEVTPFDDPARLDALLTLEMLRQLSPRDLRILRNMVRARRGATFRAQSLRDYFEPAEWYRPDPAYNDARLTRVDRQNLRLIQTAEAELGGPVTEQQVQEEAMSGA